MTTTNTTATTSSTTSTRSLMAVATTAATTTDTKRTFSTSSSTSTYNNTNNNSSIVDTVIIGGGPVGSSIAYHLGMLRRQNNINNINNNHKKGKIVVLEQDPSYQSSSAMVSAGGIRQQFSIKENVQMSAYGRDFLRNAQEWLQVENSTAHSPLPPQPQPPNVHFQEHGYLFLASTKEGMKQLQDNYNIQQQANCQVNVELLSRQQLTMEFPWLYTDDLLLGSLGRSGEGWFDPWALIQGLKQKNILDLGIEYKHAIPIQTHRDESTGCIHSMDIQYLSKSNNTKQQKGTTTTTTTSKSGQVETLHVHQIVNAAGANAAHVMTVLAGHRGLQYSLPIRPRKRCIFFFHCAPSTTDPTIVVPHICPLLVDPSSGVYVRTEGTPGKGHFLCGVSPPEQDDDDYEYYQTQTPNNNHTPCTTKSSSISSLQVDYSLWDNVIWPALYHRIPAFGNVKVQSAWAGFYEYNIVDQNAILDVHFEMPNVYMANGFSGHGLQHSLAAGRGIAELLEFGQFTSLDLSLFNFERLLDPSGKSLIYEKGIV